MTIDELVAGLQPTVIQPDNPWGAGAPTVIPANWNGLDPETFSSMLTQATEMAKSGLPAKLIDQILLEKYGLTSQSSSPFVKVNEDKTGSIRELLGANGLNIDTSKADAAFDEWQRQHQSGFFSDIGSIAKDLAGQFGPMAAMAAMAMGQPQIAAAINAGSTIANGGDIGDILTSLGTSYVAGQIAPGLTDVIGETTGFSPDLSRAISSGVIGAGKSIASGKDLDQAILSGVIGGGTGYAANNLFNSGTNAGDALSTLDEAGNHVQIFDDGSTLISDKNWMPVSGTDILGDTFNVTDGVGLYENGSQLGGEPELNFGGNLADPTDVQNLLNYNVANTTPIDQGIGKATSSAVNKFLQGLVASGNKTTGLNKSTDTSDSTGGLSQLSSLGGTSGLGGTQKLAGMSLPDIGTLQSTSLKPMVAGDNLGVSNKTPGVVGGISDQPNVNAEGNVIRGNKIRLYGEPVTAKDGGIMVEGDDGQPTTHTPEFFSEGGLKNTYVKGAGDGTSDDVPAMLANGEFVIPADVVSNLGNGSNDSGAKVLNEFLTVIRSHKRNADSKKLPPDSKGPLAYLLEAKKKA